MMESKNHINIRTLKIAIRLIEKNIYYNTKYEFGKLWRK